MDCNQLFAFCNLFSNFSDYLRNIVKGAKYRFILHIHLILLLLISICSKDLSNNFDGLRLTTRDEHEKS